MNGAAFGIAPTAPTLDDLTPEQMHAAKQAYLAEVAKVRGNRAHRRHPVDTRSHHRRPITAEERERRNNRRRMARASRKANR